MRCPRRWRRSRRSAETTSRPRGPAATCARRSAPRAFGVLHALGRDASGIARPRWIQAGFGRPRGSADTPRNTLGFKDGTRNLDVRDRSALAEHVWSAGDPDWMRDGTYLVARRVRTLLDVWAVTTVAHQEESMGRHKASGAPLGKRGEHDEPDFDAMAADAHVRLAAPESNGGATLLRRGFNYSDGVDADTGQLDAGLFFICFQRDPRRQFVPIQRRLDRSDALNRHLVHTGSAVFACPPAARDGGFVGETLLA
jgi:deferrochelatase/peroxidase EfeB